MTEYFDVVDENNKIVGRATRKKCHTKGLWHRTVSIVIINSKKELLLQKRSLKKDLFGGYWGLTAGHIDAGENYDEAAKREMKEEVGVSLSMKKLFDFKYQHGNDNEFVRVFLCKSDGPFVPNKDEMDMISFFTLKEAQKIKLMPCTRQILQKINDDKVLRKKVFG